MTWHCYQQDSLVRSRLHVYSKVFHVFPRNSNVSFWECHQYLAWIGFWQQTHQHLHQHLRNHHHKNARSHLVKWSAKLLRQLKCQSNTWSVPVKLLHIFTCLLLVVLLLCVKDIEVGGSFVKEIRSTKNLNQCLRQFRKEIPPSFPIPHFVKYPGATSSSAPHTCFWVLRAVQLIMWYTWMGM